MRSLGLHSMSPGREEEKDGNIKIESFQSTLWLSSDVEEGVALFPSY